MPPDLAVDGVDELLQVFLAYSVRSWGSAFADILAASPGWTYAVETGGGSWRVRTGPGGATVEAGAIGGPTDLTVSGPPAALLRWLWNREQPGEASEVAVEGPRAALTELRRCIVTATQ